MYAYGLCVRDNWQSQFSGKYRFVHGGDASRSFKFFEDGFLLSVTFEIEATLFVRTVQYCLTKNPVLLRQLPSQVPCAKTSGLVSLKGQDKNQCA